MRTQRDPDLLTPHEAAAELGVTRYQLLVLAQCGGVRFVRTLGGHRRFLSADIGRLRARMNAAPAAQSS
jgi:excisionase family DNA binding protein